MLVRLLGGVEVASDAERWRTVPGKRGGVLAVLAVAAGEPVPAHELVHRVWGDAAVEAGTSAVYPHITRLRAMLPSDGAVITRSGGGYVLDVDPDRVDMLAVRRRAAEARADAEGERFPRAVRTWRHATALVRGDALAGVDGAWAGRVRRQFNAEFTSILTERFDCELRLGRHAVVVDELSAVVARHPNCEPLSELLMLALYRCGRQTEALEVFARMESRLRELLGIDASASFRKLHRQVLNQDEAIAAPPEVKLAEGPPVVAPQGGYVPPAQLPAPPRGFVGREDAVEELRRAADRSSVVVVDGMPGVGKTAIAVHTATRLTESFPDGQLYVELHGYSGDKAAVAPADALARMLRGLGAAEEEVPAGLDERAAELRTRLAGRRVLVVLDNALDAAQVRPLLPGNADCLTIVTSRRRLPELLDSEPVTLDVLGPDEAVRLLVGAVGDPRRVGEDSAEVAEIVEAAGRLPLAIRLIAARLRNRRGWTAEFMMKRLRERAVLDELSTQDVAVASAFSVSYTELEPAEQRMFRLLGLFPGPDFGSDFAAALAGVALDDAGRSLEALVDAHLLQSDAPGRYRFHDLMRLFASTVAGESELPADLEAARLCLYDATVQSLRHAIDLYDPTTRFNPALVDPVPPPTNSWCSKEEAVEWIHSESTSLWAIARDALTHRMDRHCIEMAAALCSHLNELGRDRDMDLVAQWGLEGSLRIADEACEGFFRNRYAAALFAQGDLEQAEQQFVSSLAIRRRVGDPRYIVASLANLSLFYVSMGEWTKTIDLRSEALELAVSSGLTRLELVLRIMLAYALCEVDRTAETRSQLDQAELLLPDSGGNEFTRIQLATHRGNLRRREGQPEEAQLLHELALEFYITREDVVGAAVIQAEIVHDLLDQGDWEGARTVGDTALTALNDYKDVIQRAEILILLAEVSLDRREYDEAVDQLRTAEDVARGRKAANLVAEAEWGLARVMRGLGNEADAVQYAERALAYFSRFDMPQADAIHAFLACG